MTDIYTKLGSVQQELHAPKNQNNSFGGYKYRSAEDILEAVKPVLARHELTLVVGDEVVQVGDRIYVKATAAVIDSAGDEVHACGWAREPADKKGMDSSQITGAASSYSRKYALNGLFAIDDTRDADTNEHRRQVDSAPKSSSPPQGKSDTKADPLKAKKAEVKAAADKAGVSMSRVSERLVELGFSGPSDVRLDVMVLDLLVAWIEEQ